MLEDMEFSRISSCLFVHYPVDALVRVDSNQVSFNASNDTKFSLFSPGKWVAVFVYAIGKFFNGVLYREHKMLFSAVNNSCYEHSFR